MKHVVEKTTDRVVRIIQKDIGKNALWRLRNQLDVFVRDNFDILYEGAVRLDCPIGSDYYAPKRVQLNDTRLHANQGLKYADGHKWDADEELRKTVIDLQTLIDEASKDIPAPFTLEIVKDDGK